MDASETKLEEISFEVGDGFGYLFDFGDEWEHDISVKKIIPLDPKEKYPKVLKITGKIPEQYPDYDEEDEE